jgi:hypothetical protein
MLRFTLLSLGIFKLGKFEGKALGRVVDKIAEGGTEDARVDQILEYRRGSAIGLGLDALTRLLDHSAQRDRLLVLHDPLEQRQHLV